MFNQLSLKIGLLFFVGFILIESILFYFLYMNLASDRIHEVLSSLLARGNSHRDVLEQNFNPITLEHVALMESEGEPIVVITNASLQVTAKSDPLNDSIRGIILNQHVQNVAYSGEVIEDDWKNHPYISTVSPITVDHEIKGYVFMFNDSRTIHRLINHLEEQFVMAGMTTVILTIVMVFFLTRFITMPLIRIKNATEEITQGNLEIELNQKRRDELGQLAFSINSLARELRRLKQERNEFLASVSHELRTPLTYLKGYTDVLKRKNLSSENRQKYLAIIQEEAEHLSRLVKNLFDLAKMEQHQFSIQKEEIRLCDLLEKVKKKIEPACAEKNLFCGVSCNKDVKIKADPERMEQVLLNVLDNAIKYTPPGKKIDVYVKDDPSYTEISVEDEGEGIPEEHLPYIFDRLYRIDKSRSRKKGGTGIGLSIVKEIVQLHHGTIHAENKITGSTRIRIVLPKEDKSSEKGTDRG